VKKRANRERYEQRLDYTNYRVLNALIQAEKQPLLVLYLPCRLNTDVFIKILGTAYYNGVRMFDQALL